MSEMPALLARLIAESGRQWRVPARVTVEADGAVHVSGLGREIVVTRAGKDLPFRWFVTVTTPGQTAVRRPALSVVSVLRQVRLQLDPAYEKQRIRVAPPSFVPQDASSPCRA